MNEHHEPGDAVVKPADATTSAADRVGVLTGDRLCVKCGFNLHGQTIHREPHYQLLSVRCPECSTLAALQEYPIVSKWVGRWAAALAMGWLGLVLTLAFLTGLSLYLSAEGVASACTRPAARQIGIAFAQYARENEQPESSGSFYAKDQLAYLINNPDAADHWVEPTWVREHDLHQITSQGPRYSFRALAVFAPALIGLAAWGVAWSVLLLHRRIRGRMLALGIVAILTMGWAVWSHVASRLPQPGITSGFFASYWSWGINAFEVARIRFGLAPALAAIGVGYAAMIPGLIFGRKLARLFVRIFLPPHLRGPLAMLWHADGLPSPPTRGEFWIRG